MNKHLLRTLALSCVMCLMSNVSHAQYFPIPDANFAAWLHTHGYDSCMVGNNLDTICSMSFEQPTNDLDLSNLGISNPAGLQYISWYDINCIGCGKSINLSHNNLTHFPPQLFERLWNLTINLSYNHIDTLMLGPDYFELYVLDVSHNNMHSFVYDSVHTNFQFRGLNLNYNQLDSFPYTYSNGGTGFGLQIRSNHLTQLPVCNCTSIDCGNNQISSLNSGFLWHLSGLYIDSNLFSGPLNISALGTYWNTFYEFDCSHNAITSFSNISFANMPYGFFKCNDNNITGPLPHMPTNIPWLDCHNNPNLTCIANLPNAPTFYLDYSNTAVQCLPRQFPNCVYTCTPGINAVPTCDMYNNVYGCPQYSNMEGIVYSDLDSNCVKDSTDMKLGYLKTLFKHNGSVGQQIYTDWNGHYSFDEINYGTYTLEVDTTGLPVTVYCPDSAYYSAIVDSQELYQTGFNFGMNCRQGFDVGDMGMAWGQFLPHTDSYVNFGAGDVSELYGFHCAAGISGQVQVSYSGPVTYVNSVGTLSPSSISGNTITWNIADFGTLNINTAFELIFHTDSTAQLHDMVCFNIHVTPVVGDINPSNNSFFICDEIRVSYDPNIKSVYPSGEIADTTKWLTYTIRFQNTGTAPAQHVMLVDTLDSDLDINTFQLLNFSHPNITQISEAGIVKFNFPNINLPDSNINEPASHGYVQYKIKLKDNLPAATTINNTAFIYFDFNSPVVTNTTTNTTTGATGIKSVSREPLAVSIYPNPASNSFTISVDESMLGSTLSITDITGKQMAAVQLSTRNTQLATGNFSSGVYFVSIESERGRTTKKLVIEK